MERNFSSLIPVLQRRFWPAFATFAAVIGASVAYLMTTPPSYEAKARLIIDDKRLTVSEFSRNLVELPSANSVAQPNATQAELITSQDVLQSSMAKAFPNESSLEQEQRARDISDKIKVTIIPATNILELTYSDNDNEQAATILNAVSQTAVEKSQELIRAEAKSVKDFLAGEVPEQEEITKAAEKAESDYRKQNRLVDVEQQTETLVESLADLEQQERTVLAQLQETTAQARELQRITQLGSVSSAYVAGRVGQDQELEDLRNRIADLDAQLATARSRLTDTHPDVRSLLEERSSLNSLYSQRASRVVPRGQGVPDAGIASDELSQALTANYINAETERQSLAERLAVIQTERAKLQNQLDQLPIKQRPLASLIRQREEATRTLELLQGKLAEAKIAENQLVSNIRIIDYAQKPEDESWPNNKVVLVVATAAGLSLSVGVMLLLEALDNKMYDVSETERALKLPILGVLPEVPFTAFSLERPEQFLDNPSLVEPYRMLLKSLEFRTQEKLNSVVISSTVSGEGKSIVTAHFAALGAMLSKRTLIIDADLRRSQQHNLLGVSPQPGLTNVLEGQLSLLEAIQSTGVENLSILTSGSLATRPSAMLESPRMKSLLSEASANYDLVVIDTPPVTSCADAHTLSRGSDGLVVITRPSFTPKDDLYQAITDLNSKGIPLLGVVVNGITSQTKKYYRYALDGYSPKHNNSSSNQETPHNRNTRPIYPEA